MGASAAVPEGVCDMGLWLLAGFGALLATLAFLSVRRLRKKVEDLNHSYWELRYDYTRLRSKIARLDPDRQLDAEAESPPPPADASYVPLTSLKSGVSKS